eukprot:365347-Amphidinium_carterae.1
MIAKGPKGVSQIIERFRHFWVLRTEVALVYPYRPFQVVALFGTIAKGSIGVSQICQRFCHFWVLRTVVAFFYP